MLRNAATGVEARTTTTKQGGYRFSGLPPGEYTLVADSPRLGEGRIAGIFVAAGHESRVQTALSLDRQSPEPLVSPSQVRSFTDPAPPSLEPPAACYDKCARTDPAAVRRKTGSHHGFRCEAEMSRRRALETLPLTAARIAEPRPSLVPPAMIATGVPANEVVAAPVRTSEPETPVETAMLALPAHPRPGASRQ